MLLYVKEVENLALQYGVNDNDVSMQAIGYKEIYKLFTRSVHIFYLKKNLFLRNYSSFFVFRVLILKILKT